MLKILHISNTSFEKFNGIATVVPRLVSAQNIEEFSKASLITTRQTNQIFNFPVYYSSSLSSFYRILKAQKPDLIVIHDIYDVKYFVLSLIILLKRIPYIIVPHSCLTKAAQKKGWFKKTIANYTLFLPLILFSKAISFLNAGEKNKSIFKWKRSIVVPNGIDSIKAVNEKMNDNISVFFIGRIDLHHKGLDLLVQSLSCIKSELLLKKVKVSIYGNSVKQGKNDVNQEEILNRLIEHLGLKELVKCHEAVYNEEKNMVFEQSNIMILTSRYEGMPMSILEALACGLPVIVTEATNMSDLILKYNAGWLVDSDPKIMSQQILGAIGNYLQNKSDYQKNALSAAKELLWNNIAKISIKEYKNLLNG